MVRFRNSFIHLHIPNRLTITGLQHGWPRFETVMVVSAGRN
jgi:hypothetical protein